MHAARRPSIGVLLCGAFGAVLAVGGLGTAIADAVVTGADGLSPVATALAPIGSGGVGIVTACALGARHPHRADTAGRRGLHWPRWLALLQAGLGGMVIAYFLFLGLAGLLAPAEQVIAHFPWTVLLGVALGGLWLWRGWRDWAATAVIRAGRATARG